MKLQKNTKLRIVLVVFLLIVVSSITPVKNIPKNNIIDSDDVSMSQYGDPYEPNNDFNAAKDINSEKLKWLKLIQEDDDWFKFDIFPGFERVIVKVVYLVADGNIGVELFDEYYSYIIGTDYYDDCEFIDYNVTTPGTYYLHIYGYNLRTPYELLWDALNSSAGYDDNYELNNDEIEAGINADITGFRGEWLSGIIGLGVQRNLDYFKIYIDSINNRLLLEVIFDDYYDNIEVEIWNHNLTIRITEAWSTNHNEYINWVISSSGTYYILVRGNDWGNTYDLRWDTIPEEDNYDMMNPNDIRTQATDLTMYHDAQLSSINGSGIQSEDDWYKIDVSNDEKRLIVDVKFRYKFGDINLEIIDEWGGWIVDSSSSSNGEFIDYLLPSGGIYYIHIWGDNTGNIYDFWWEDVSHDDWLEKDEFGMENDDFEHARRIDPRYYPGLRIIEYDEDWFKMNLNTGDVINLFISYNTWEGELHLELYDPSNNRKIGSHTGTGTENIEYFVEESDEQGEWRIRVYRVSGVFDIDVIYNLEIWVNGMQAGDDPYEYNNWFDEAYYLGDDEQKWLRDVKGTAFQGDEEFFIIDVTPGFEHLMINLSIIHGSGNIWFTIHDASRNYIGNSYSVSYGQHFDQFVNHGIYYIQISGDDSGIEYDLWWDDLRTDFRPDDFYEENDNHTSAYYLQENRWLSSINLFGLQYDDDWYEIFVDEEELQLIVEVSYDFAEGMIGVRIYDEDLVLITKNFTMRDNEFINYVLPSNGTYYIRIFGDDSGNVYDLWWETVEYSSEQIRQIPGFDLFIIIGAVLGVITIVMIKQKRSKLISQ